MIRGLVPITASLGIVMKLGLTSFWFATLFLCAVSFGDTFIFDPDAGEIDGAATATINGVEVRAGALSGGVREFHVLGDFVLNSGDTMTATLGSENAIRLIVANDVLIDNAATINLSAIGQDGRAGGGAGGDGRSGGTSGLAGLSPGSGAMRAMAVSRVQETAMVALAIQGRTEPMDRTAQGVVMACAVRMGAKV